MQEPDKILVQMGTALEEILECLFYLIEVSASFPNEMRTALVRLVSANTANIIDLYALLTTLTPTMYMQLNTTRLWDDELNAKLKYPVDEANTIISTHLEYLNTNCDYLDNSRYTKLTTNLCRTLKELRRYLSILEAQN